MHKEQKRTKSRHKIHMIPSAFYLCSTYKAQHTDMPEKCNILGWETVQSERDVPTFQRIRLSPLSDVMKHLFTY